MNFYWEYHTDGAREVGILWMMFDANNQVLNPIRSQEVDSTTFSEFANFYLIPLNKHVQTLSDF